MFWNRLINKGFGRGLIAIFSILICIVVFFPGCGRKAPPVPPDQARPPAVDDLSSSIDEERPLKNAQFCSSSRKAKILTGGIYRIFRGLKFEPDTGIGQKGAFCKGL